jgi:hypothetical protein
VDRVLEPAEHVPDAVGRHGRRQPGEADQVHEPDGEVDRGGGRRGGVRDHGGVEQPEQRLVVVEREEALGDRHQQRGVLGDRVHEVGRQLPARFEQRRQPRVSLELRELVDGDGGHRPLVEAEHPFEHGQLEAAEEDREVARVGPVGLAVVVRVAEAAARREQAHEVGPIDPRVEGHVAERELARAAQPITDGAEQDLRAVGRPWDAHLDGSLPPVHVDLRPVGARSLRAAAYPSRARSTSSHDTVAAPA